MKTVYFAMPKERQVMSEAVSAWEEICMYLGSQPTKGVEYKLLPIGYQGIDAARNYLAFKFMELATNYDDTLVMLDNDHNHPRDIVERLAQTSRPVVGALAFKRKAPYFPVAYVRELGTGAVKIPKTYPQKVVQVASVGGAAIAIQKRTFDKLVGKKFYWPWFRFGYEDWSLFRTGEDIYFYDLCMRCEIPVYCDFTLVTPHLDTTERTNASWQAWLQANPDLIWNGESIADSLVESVEGVE